MQCLTWETWVSGSLYFHLSCSSLYRFFVESERLCFLGTSQQCPLWYCMHNIALDKPLWSIPYIGLFECHLFDDGFIAQLSTLIVFTTWLSQQRCSLDQSNLWDLLKITQYHKSQHDCNFMSSLQVYEYNISKPFLLLFCNPQIVSAECSSVNHGSEACQVLCTTSCGRYCQCAEIRARRTLTLTLNIDLCRRRYSHPWAVPAANSLTSISKRVCYTREVWVLEKVWRGDHWIQVSIWKKFLRELLLTQVIFDKHRGQFNPVLLPSQICQFIFYKPLDGVDSSFLILLPTKVDIASCVYILHLSNIENVYMCSCVGKPDPSAELIMPYLPSEVWWNRIESHLCFCSTIVQEFTKLIITHIDAECNCPMCLHYLETFMQRVAWFLFLSMFLICTHWQNQEIYNPLAWEDRRQLLISVCCHSLSYHEWLWLHFGFSSFIDILFENPDDVHLMLIDNITMTDSCRRHCLWGELLLFSIWFIYICSMCSFWTDMKQIINEFVISLSTHHSFADMWHQDPLYGQVTELESSSLKQC